ncbi:MAG: metallophosphoesterase [Thermomicrobiales bacterium]|nr:metallophosphoesterase [Thermomicrobiales bacterium]
MKVGVISEVHLVPPGSPRLQWHNPFAQESAARYLALAVQRLSDAGVDAIAVLGDITHFGERAYVEQALGVLAEPGIPVWIVPGNHDLTSDGSSLASEQETISIAPWQAARFDGAPLYGVAIERGLDGVGYRATGLDGFAPNGAGPAVVLSHFPVISMRDRLAEAELADAGDLKNVADLHQAVAGMGRPTIVVHGHLHVRATTVAGMLLQLSCAALIEAPYEISIVTFDPAGAAPTVRRTVESVVPVDAERLPVLSPADETWRFREGAWRPE